MRRYASIQTNVCLDRGARDVNLSVLRCGMNQTPVVLAAHLVPAAMLSVGDPRLNGVAPAARQRQSNGEYLNTDGGRTPSPLPLTLTYSAAMAVLGGRRPCLPEKQTIVSSEADHARLMLRSTHDCEREAARIRPVGPSELGPKISHHAATRLQEYSPQ